MRVQVSIGPETVQRIDKLAKKVGITRSALCSMLIFQSLPTEESTEEELLESLNYSLTEHEIEKSKYQQREA